MGDVVVTVPKARWREWIDEGCHPGDAMPEGVGYYHFDIGGRVPEITPGERVYIVAHGRVRGYSPLCAVDCIDWRDGRPVYSLIRKGDAEAVTIPEQVEGFRGYRYRWWSRADETPFPNWKTEGVSR